MRRLGTRATHGRESAVRRVAMEKCSGTLTVWIARRRRSRRDFVDLVRGRVRSVLVAVVFGLGSIHWEERASRRVMLVREHAA